MGQNLAGNIQLKLAQLLSCTTVALINTFTVLFLIFTLSASFFFLRENINNKIYRSSFWHVYADALFSPFLCSLCIKKPCQTNKTYFLEGENEGCDIPSPKKNVTRTINRIDLLNSFFISIIKVCEWLNFRLKFFFFFSLD